VTLRDSTVLTLQTDIGEIDLLAEVAGREKDLSAVAEIESLEAENE